MNKTNVMRVLEEAGIPYRAHEFDVSDGVLDAVSAAERINAAPEQVFKTLVAENPEGQLFVFVIPGPESLDLKKAARAAGQKSLSMLPQKKLLPQTGYVHGGCSPIGMKKPYPTYFEECALLYDEIYVSAGHVGQNVSLAPAPLIALINAETADLIQ